MEPRKGFLLSCYLFGCRLLSPLPCCCPGKIPEEQRFVYTLPCPQAHPGLCCSRDEWCMAEVREAGKELHKYMSKQPLGSFHFFRFGAIGKEAGVWVNICHVHGNPKLVLLSSATLDSASRKLSLDNPNTGFNFMVGLTFLGKMYKSFGRDFMMTGISASPAALDTAVQSTSASSVYLSASWPAEQTQQEVTLVPVPAAVKKAKVTPEAKAMFAGIKALPKEVGTSAKKAQLGVIIRMPGEARPGGAPEASDDDGYFSDDVAVDVVNAHHSSSEEENDDVVLPPPPPPFEPPPESDAGSRVEQGLFPY